MVWTLLVAALLGSAGGEPLPAQGVEKVVGEIAFEGAEDSALRGIVEVQVGAPLDARDVRDSVRALHATTRFSRVAAYAEEMPDGRLRVVFWMKPVEKLIAVSFPGHAVLAESLLFQTANLRINAEFQPELVPLAVDAMLAAYRRVGYRSARVEPLRRDAPGGVALDFRIEEGRATRIADVRFEGEPGLSEEELLAALRIARGDVLNLAQLDEGLRGVRERYRRAGRLRARVDAARVEQLPGEQVRVVIAASAGPLVRFRIRGNRAFSDDVLASHLALDGDEPLDAQAAQEMAARLRRFYVTAGFLRARIAERQMTSRDGADEVVFSIEEGKQVRVEQLTISGNQKIASAVLRAQLVEILRDNVPRDPAARADPAAIERMGLMGSLRKGHAPHTSVDPESVFDPVLYARAIKQFEDLYKSHGFLSARAGPPRLEPINGNANRVAVTIPIKEGAQTTVRRIAVEGGGDVSAKELDAAIALRVGQPFNYLQAEEGRAALTQIFTRRGHLYARVEDDEDFADETKVDVRYRIQPGPVVKVGYVEVVGHRRTLEGLVLDVVGLRRGDILTPDVLDRAQQALLRTGLFFSATLTPRNPEVAEGEKTVQVELRERPTKDFQASLGFSLADGPRTTAQWTQSNLGGRNLTFTAVGRADFPFGRFPTESVCPSPQPAPCETHIRFPHPLINAFERVVDLGLSAPRLWPLTDALRAGVDLIHQRAIQPSYDLTKYSTQVSVDLTRRRPFSAGIAYEAGYQILNRGSLSVEDVIANIDKTISRLPAGQMIFGSLRPTVLVDVRDDPARPRAGFLATLSGDFLRSFTGNETFTDTGITVVHVNLLRVQGMAAAYLPLPALSSIVFSARGGRVIQLDAQSLTPGDRRFYLGGATSLRGFHEEALQPQDEIDQLHEKVRACSATLSGAGCTPEAQLLAAGATSGGGDQYVAFSAELRLPFTQSLELALFWDAGNLWRAPTSILDHLVLRHAVGGGLRWLTPVGRVAIDIGVNLAPDALLGEPQFGPYFSIDPI